MYTRATIEEKIGKKKSAQGLEIGLVPPALQHYQRMKTHSSNCHPPMRTSGRLLELELKMMIISLPLSPSVHRA
ncbi:hypothetical protein C368_00648 [Cryptococcus neoformans 125.91]|nr:hypothetical protein C368_00648 [Cryptococcus neoformans var. grubii 125.91]OWZ78051.1 hypothetical protein C365_02840 [Cryptococcus neoformans var. grubii Bt85]OXM79162.1 hypothetical protein C364_02653 [Cryptococcus neoformans var. grubii Bt63]